MEEEPMFRDLSKPTVVGAGVHSSGRGRTPPPSFFAALGSESLPPRDNRDVQPAPRRAKRYSENEWKLLLDATDDLSELALNIGRKLSTVRRMAQKFGWKNPNARPAPLADLPDSDVAYIRHEITTGTAVAEIAKEFGVNKTSIYAFMKKHQIPLPNPQQRTFCPDSPRVHVAYAELKSIRKAAAAVGLEFWRVNYILKHFNPDGTRR
jgi:hypothetical protein